MAKKDKAVKEEKEEVKEEVEVKAEAPVVKDKSGLKRIKVTPEELAKLQDEHLLVGYDPEKQEALIR